MSRLTKHKEWIVHMETPAEHDRPYREQVQYASLGARGLALGIDMVVSTLIAFVLSGIVSVFNETLAFMLAVFIFFAYYIISEMIWGTTAGKRLAGIRVIDMDGKPISPAAAMVRNIIKVFGLYTLFLTLVEVILISNSQDNQRLGDLLANTLVIKD